GLVDSERGVSRYSHNLGFRNVPFKEVLERQLGVPVFVENVIRMTTLAEKWLGAGKDVSDLICIGIGSGLGAGIVVGSQLYRGPRSEEHTSELQSRENLVCRLLLEKKKKKKSGRSMTEAENA